VADGIVPPETPGYSEDVKGFTYDPERARELLEESRYAGNMPRIILTYPGTGGDSPDTLQAIQAGWQDTLGIQVDLQASEYSAFLRELRRGTFQMFSTGWIADYPDPENFLEKLFGSESVQNEQGYSNPRVDELLDEARVEPDTQRRYELYAEAEQLILDDFAIIPTYWPTEHLLVKPCVQNWPDISMSVPFYRYLEIKED
jgi:oligopeptide transport system substrate-binding protein